MRHKIRESPHVRNLLLEKVGPEIWAQVFGRAHSRSSYETTRDRDEDASHTTRYLRSRVLIRVREALTQATFRRALENTILFKTTRAIPFAVYERMGIGVVNTRALTRLTITR